MQNDTHDPTAELGRSRVILDAVISLSFIFTFAFFFCRPEVIEQTGLLNFLRNHPAQEILRHLW